MAAEVKFLLPSLLPQRRPMNAENLRGSGLIAAGALEDGVKQRGLGRGQELLIQVALCMRAAQLSFGPSTGSASKRGRRIGGRRENSRNGWGQMLWSDRIAVGHQRAVL